MGFARARLSAQRAGSVRADWFAWLSEEKGGLFDAAREELEALYSMLSIVLDEALALRDRGQLVHAREQAGVTADLFDRLAHRLLSSLRALEDHGRHFGTLPNVAPLNPEFFRGGTAQRIARKNNLLSKVLLSARSKFFHKLRALSEIVEELGSEFREAAEEIADGSSVCPGTHWEALDIGHYDLNTCLRETVVVLKSFLCALHNEEVQSFWEKLQTSSDDPAGRCMSPAIRHRRATLFRRE